MAQLFKRKPLEMIVAEAKAEGEQCLERSLGPVSLTALVVGAVIGAGIFVMSGLGAHYAGPSLMLSFVFSGLGCAFAALCYAEFAAMIPLAGSAYTYAYATLGELFAWIIGWDLTLEYAMGASTVSSGWSNNFVEFLKIFGLNLPLWLSYDHWTGIDTAQKIIARGIVTQTHPGIIPGSPEFNTALDQVMSTQSADLLARGHALLNAPHIFGVDIGFNLPAFLIALIITAILVVGIQESAKFNSIIVFVKVTVVLFIIGLGIKYIHPDYWGHSWTTFAPFGFAGISAAAGYIFFAYIGFDAISTTAQEAKNPQRDLPIGIILSLLICTVLYVSVAGVLTGMVPWKLVNVEAPLTHAFLDHNVGWAGNVVTCGALAGLTSVMLVMLIGQTRTVRHGFGRAAAEEVLRRHSSQVSDSMEEHDSGGMFGRVGRLGDADRQHWQDGEYWNPAGVCDGVRIDCGAAVYGAGSAAAVPDAGDLLWRQAADCAGAGRRVQPDDDDQPGQGELDSAGCVADYRDVRLLPLFREAQQGAGAGQAGRGGGLSS